MTQLGYGAMKAWSKLACALILFALFSLFLAPTSVYAATTITVDGNCSLANAIRSANGDAQVEESGDSDGNDDCEDGTEPDDTADPPETGEDVVQLSGNITLTEVLPDITSQITIEGRNKTISGDEQFPIFLMQDVSVTIKDLTITKGKINVYGGAIYTIGGDLSLSNSAIKSNVAGDIGGGIYSNDTNVTISDSSIIGNTAERSHGGAIYFVSSDGSHTFDILNSTFNNNTSAEDGGALKIAGGIVDITKSSFIGNQGDEGGAIESNSATLTIENSTFSSNSAREGGGLSSFNSDVTLTHTTWALNSADEQGGGIAIIGWTGSFKIRNTLITNSTSGGDCHPGPNPEIIIEFTGNFIQDGSCNPPAADEEATATPDPNTAQSQGRSGASEELRAQHAGDHDDEDTILVDPLLRGVSGDPPYYPLQWGSQAIDGADPAYCLDDDQPGTARPQYDNCDIGAYEYPKPPDPPPVPPVPRDEPDPPDPRDEPDPPDPRDQPDPPDSADPSPVPVPPLTPEVCIIDGRVYVLSHDDDISCEKVDIIALDKHPALAGIRIAVRIWSGDNRCIYVVTGGDNLFRLAIDFDTTVETLKRHNNLVSNQLLVG